MSLKPTELLMSGIKVKFPAKAYPSQVAMMSKIVNSLQRSQNSLLESPTGSGKSLALLCSSLAWQQAEQTKADEFNKMLEQATVNQDEGMREALITMAGPEGVEYEDSQTNLPPDDVNGGGFLPPLDPDEDDFISQRNGETSAYHLPPNETAPRFTSNVEHPLLLMPKRKKVPKIYFGTRTHKQVAQIVRELKKTAYAGVRMTILASREHTCVHPTVSKSFNKNQDCNDLMDRKKGGGCRFQANVKQKMASHYSVRSYMGHDQAWDLEELVTVGKKQKACPYFAVRELKNTAQLIICPYNYLVDPRIRDSMEISLKNQIVILDEAHNIEDSARSAASGKFGLDDVTAALMDCERMVDCKVLPEVHGNLASFCSRLGTWMQKAALEASDYTDFQSSSKVWTGTNGLAEWNELIFYPDSYGQTKLHLEEAIKEQKAAAEGEDGFEEGPGPILLRKSTDLLEGIFTILDFMNRRDSVYRDDYRIAVVKAQERKKGPINKRGFVGKGDKSSALVNTITLHFWCLNPGVCFDELKHDVRSIILTSGTLSPMGTFASELDTKFSVTLEANHVIHKSQVWVGTLSKGLRGGSLNGNYQNVNTFSFQDELGQLVVELCRTVPHGILLFFTSYKMLNDLSERWKTTGIWQQIYDKKEIVQEPKFADQLDVVMKDFYNVIEDTNHHPNQVGQNGALFMAVFRGKVSEGLDFADNNARAVVCVGIPFPAFKDTLVDLKKKYNDSRFSQKQTKLLSGREWYEIQAFRALNQALGRCIRHKNDWGAILMVDERYSRNPLYTRSLSKWVRDKVVGYDNAGNMISSLAKFSADMKLMEAEKQVEADTFNANNAVTEKDQESTKVSSPDAIDGSTSPYFNTKLAVADRSPISAWISNGNSIASKAAKLIQARTKPVEPQSHHLDIQSNLDTKTHLVGLQSKSSPGLNQKKEELPSNKDDISPPLEKGDWNENTNGKSIAGKAAKRVQSRSSPALKSNEFGRSPNLKKVNQHKNARNKLKVFEFQRRQAAKDIAAEINNPDSSVPLAPSISESKEINGQRNRLRKKSRISYDNLDTIDNSLNLNHENLPFPEKKVSGLLVEDETDNSLFKVNSAGTQEKKVNSPGGGYRSKLKMFEFQDRSVEEAVTSSVTTETSRITSGSNLSSKDLTRADNIVSNSGNHSMNSCVTITSSQASNIKKNQSLLVISPSKNMKRKRKMEIISSDEEEVIKPESSKPVVAEMTVGSIDNTSLDCDFDLSEECDFDLFSDFPMDNLEADILNNTNIQSNKVYDHSDKASGMMISSSVAVPDQKHVKVANITKSPWSRTIGPDDSGFVSGPSSIKKLDTCPPFSHGTKKDLNVKKTSEIDDQDLLDMMLRRRKRSSIVPKVHDDTIIVPEVPIVDCGDLFATENSNDLMISKPILSDVSNQPLSNRRPLFSAHKIDISSDEEVLPRQQMKPSLSSADEIDEEPAVERRVKTAFSKKKNKLKRKKPEKCDDSIINLCSDDDFVD